MNNCYTIVTIKNFPSRNEILLFFNKFIITNKINSDYKIENTSNCINLKFLESDIGYLFVEQLKTSIINNELYKNLSIKITEKQSKLKSKSTSNIFSKRNKGIIPISNSSNLTLSRNKITDNSYYHIHMLDISKKAGVITNSSPYINFLHKEYLDKIENKKKWVCNKDFITSVGRAENNKNIFIIKNYVNITPSNSPLLYKFRNENKTKWMSKKGFILY
jgi:hypothetical protein